jgi:hypothetical protein
VGLAATYVITTVAGTRELRLIDPAIMLHTLPWEIADEVAYREASDLRVTWTGTLVPPQPGTYEVRLDIQDATGALRVSDREARIEELTTQWESVSMTVAAAAEPLPLTVELRGHPGYRPNVRLFWRPPGAEPELIPPQVLRPSGWELAQGDGS